MITRLLYDTLDNSILEYDRLASIGSASDRWIVRAKRQTAGVGRNENTWHSPRGGLWLSFDFHYPRAVPSFPLYVGYCLHNVLSRSFGLDKLSVKWPNDLYLEDKKLAGILCQHRQNPSRYLVCLGLNSNCEMDDVLLELNAANLSSYMKMPISNSCLASLVVQSIRNHSAMLATPEVYLDYCGKHLYGLGREAELESGGSMLRGRISGLSDEGFLLLRDNEGRIETINHGSLRII